MADTAPVTQIDASYLNGLKAQLQELLDTVNDQITGLGTKGVTSDTTSFIQPVTSQLKVAAGTAGFDVGKELNTALSALGGSVSDQLAWLKKVLTDMISEITTTVNSFSASESLNEEAVETLATDFANTISDIGTPAASGSSAPASSGSSSPAPSGSSAPAKTGS
jgi:chemotaxis protein histidine kinase CheA